MSMQPDTCQPSAASHRKNWWEWQFTCTKRSGSKAGAMTFSIVENNLLSSTYSWVGNCGLSASRLANASCCVFLADQLGCCQLFSSGGADGPSSVMYPANAKQMPCMRPTYSPVFSR